MRQREGGKRGLATVPENAEKDGKLVCLPWVGL
jgi:hypothetical protein